MNPIEWVRRRVRGPIKDESLLAVRSAAAEAQRSRIPQMAAALSFRTLFGLIPVLVVGLLIANLFLERNQRADVIQRVVEFAGLGEITVTEETYDVGPPKEGEGALGGERRLGDEIGGLVSGAGSRSAFRTIGLIGLLTLIYAAVALLVEIERAFNQVFRVPRGRSWWRRVVNYWALLTLGGIGLAGSFYVGAKFQIEAKRLVQSQALGAASETLILQGMGYAVTVLISTALLTMVYATVPNTRVKPLSALVGGFIGALLWEAGKFGFGLYVAYSTGYAKLYGSLALIPLFMLWVYYTWLIVLFGLMVVYQFQFGRKKTHPEPIFDFGPAMVDPASAVVVMTAMARAMASGTPQSIKTLALSTGLGEAVVTIVVSRFAERGLLLRVEREGDGGDALYTLARTPGSIRVGEVLTLGFELAGGPEANPVVERMRKAQVSAAGSETLADIAGTPGDGLRTALPSGGTAPQTGPAGETATGAPAAADKPMPTAKPARS